MTCDPKDQASTLLARLADLWTSNGLPLFDLAAAMMVHGAAGVFAEVGEARLREILAELPSGLMAGAPPGTSRAQH